MFSLHNRCWIATTVLATVSAVIAAIDAPYWVVHKKHATKFINFITLLHQVLADINCCFTGTLSSKLAMN